jgi:hypothetical protein
MTWPAVHQLSSRTLPFAPPSSSESSSECAVVPEPEVSAELADDRLSAVPGRAAPPRGVARRRRARSSNELVPTTASLTGSKTRPSRRARSCSEQGVRLAQQVQVGPYTPAEKQL